ncbi:zinc-finger domain-containing protein [Bacillus sp. UNC322MFChir4.1]|uniref:zinc-finger domain-containing protein n=1 Tax=Bacillus sp. UNC322MFChir4.1 TaxID=1449045 RepID=UPI0009DCA069|nr:zinc-finger domain-containing protein [Bacillus sp. UNC322MFChir4.1]
MNRAEKRKIRLQILDTQDEYCKGCESVPKKKNNKLVSQDERIAWCYANCPIGKSLKTLGESLDEGRTEHMGEERNWDKLCAKAEKLREENLSWAKIADHLGVTESSLYYHIAKRRDENQPPVKRVGTPKQQSNTKPLVQIENVVEKKSQAIEVTELAQEDILETLKVQIKELVEEKNRLEKEVLAETKLRLKLENYTEFYQKQYREMEEDYSTLKNEFNAITEKGFEQRAEIKKLHEQLQISHTELEKERSHRLELQGKSQALGMALKAVL